MKMNERISRFCQNKPFFLVWAFMNGSQFIFSCPLRAADGCFLQNRLCMQCVARESLNRRSNSVKPDVRVDHFLLNVLAVKQTKSIRTSRLLVNR